MREILKRLDSERKGVVDGIVVYGSRDGFRIGI